MKIDLQIELVKKKLEGILREHLKSGRHFRIEINGVRSKITELKSGVRINKLDKEIIILKDHWDN